MKRRVQRLVGPVGLAVVALGPAIGWVLDSVDRDRFAAENPYDISDVHLALIFGMLSIVVEILLDQGSAGQVGDESKIILNRNQTDYYEIWEEVRAYRDVEILAVGHSFNTLWFNFIKKFLYEVISNERHWDSVHIRLISTHSNPGSYVDIRDFYGRLEMQLALKIQVSLSSFESDTLFFTGLCVNKSALWLSIREPHKAAKSNEHVREWRRNAGGSAEKMVNWYVGLAEHLAAMAPPEVLTAAPAAPAAAPPAQV